MVKVKVFEPRLHLIILDTFVYLLSTLTSYCRNYITFKLQCYCEMRYETIMSVNNTSPLVPVKFEITRWSQKKSFSLGVINIPANDFDSRKFLYIVCIFFKLLYSFIFIKKKNSYTFRKIFRTSCARM